MDDGQRDDKHSPLEKYNAGHYYDEHAFSPGELKERENSAAGMDPTAGGTDDIQSQEESKTHSWANNTTAQKPRSEKKDFKGFVKANKKTGPAAVIITILIGGGLLLSLLTPGLLLIHITETLTNAFNMQETSMGRRVPKVLSKKIAGEATSSCKTVTVKCKFSSLNERQFKKFNEKNSKITVVTDSATPTNGRYNVLYLEYEGQRIDAQSLPQKLNSDAAFRSEMKRVYNSKYAGYADSIWNKFRQKYRLTEKNILAGKANDEERTKAVEEHTKNGTQAGDASGRYRPVDPNDPGGEWVREDDPDGPRYTREFAEEQNRLAIDGVGELKANSDEVASSNKKTSSSVLDDADRRLRAG